MAKTGEQQFSEGLRWIKNHPAEFRELQQACLAIEQARNSDGSWQFSSITRSSIYMLAQLAGMRITNEKTFRRNNNLWSTISRFMTALHPQLERVIQHRDCEVARYIKANGLPELPSKCIYKAA